MGEDNGSGVAQTEEIPEIKSYWYPDRSANIDEIKTGFQTWRADKRLMQLCLIPLLAVFIVIAGVIVTREKSLLNDLIRLLETRKIERHPEFWMALLALIRAYYQQNYFNEPKADVLIFFTSIVLICSVIYYFLKKSKSVYLVDFITFQASDDLKVSHKRFIETTTSSGWFNKEQIDFQEKLLYRTGLGNETYFPPGILLNNPPVLNMKTSREEAEMVMFGCLDQLMERTHLQPRDIDILIVNCSLFNPTPSLAEMIINRYKLKSSIIFHNLSGMGCSASPVAIGLAKDLLQIYKNSNAIVVSTENITLNWYTGQEKSMLISNTLFRVGGAAMLLSNKWSDSWRAKYQLLYNVRVHKGANDQAYKAVFQYDDEQGKRGVAISKELLTVAGDALKSNLTILGPMVLPWSEQIKYLYAMLKRRMFQPSGGKKEALETPDFKKAFEHFCIHAGGRGIIDGLEENLKLEPHHVEPSRATLYRYGNTSSSSIWYELAFIELSGRMKRGDKVFQVALGSGVQCNSLVWKRIN